MNLRKCRLHNNVTLCSIHTAHLLNNIQALRRCRHHVMTSTFCVHNKKTHIAQKSVIYKSVLLHRM